MTYNSWPRSRKPDAHYTVYTLWRRYSVPGSQSSEPEHNALSMQHATMQAMPWPDTCAARVRYSSSNLPGLAVRVFRWLPDLSCLMWLARLPIAGVILYNLTSVYFLWPWLSLADWSDGASWMHHCTLRHCARWHIPDVRNLSHNLNSIQYHTRWQLGLVSM